MVPRRLRASEIVLRLEIAQAFLCVPVIRSRVKNKNRPKGRRPESQKGTATMYPHSRLASGTFRCIFGLVLLLFGFSDAGTAARGDVTRQRTAERSVSRAPKPAAPNAEPD